MLKPTYSVWNKEEPMQHWKEHFFGLFINDVSLL